MFVPHSPDMVYDVERHSDRCVCGCSALATCHDYNSVNCGYCESCAKKRADFVYLTLIDQLIDLNKIKIVKQGTRHFVDTIDLSDKIKESDYEYSSI